MIANRIRVLSLALLQRPRDGALLVGMHDPDAHGEARFCRLLGGGVEFGERSEETVCRELLEELGAVVRPLQFIGALENIFVYRDQPGHEVVLNWRVEFEDPALYEVEQFTVVEGEFTHPAQWVQPADLAARGVPLYPDGILDLLARAASEAHA